LASTVNSVVMVVVLHDEDVLHAPAVALRAAQRSSGSLRKAPETLGISATQKPAWKPV